ncbi:MAG TPA: hypothetical protein VGP06_17805, partial [Janthinobacterium sp.]|nr:hypothetical protein [Janthinobacterium sp.]
MTTSELVAVEHLYLIAGNLGLPGAPVLNLSVLYNPDGSPASLSGEAVIAQAIAPPGGRIVIKSISGPVYGLGFGKETRAFSLTGEYVQS